MASGKRDYWTGLDFGKLTFSNFQTGIYLSDDVDISTLGAQDEIWRYTVPTDHIFHITEILISSNFPAIHRALIFMTGLSVRQVYFDLNFKFPSTEGGDLVMVAGADIWCVVQSGTAEDCNFVSSLIGYIEQIN